MASLADLLNSPSAFEFEDKTYQLRQPTVVECGLYQRWLESEARVSAAHATDLSDEDRRNLLRDVTADIAAQTYAWGGEVCVRSLRTPNGVAKMMAIICHDQGVTFEVAKRVCEKRLADIAALIQGAVEEDPGGNALRRLLTSVGMPPDWFATSSSGSSTPPAPGPSASPPSPP